MHILIGYYWWPIKEETHRWRNHWKHWFHVVVRVFSNRSQMSSKLVRTKKWHTRLNQVCHWCDTFQWSTRPSSVFVYWLHVLYLQKETVSETSAFTCAKSHVFKEIKNFLFGLKKSKGKVLIASFIEKMFIDWVWSGWKGEYLALGHVSLRHDLEPNIFPSSLTLRPCQ